MSKRHQASRRRTYGRRQHEIHERTDRSSGFLGWLDEPEISAVGEPWADVSSGRTVSGAWSPVRGTA
jgi:hypothetical protein